MYLNIDKKKISRSVLFFDVNDNFETLIKKDLLFKDFKNEIKYIESILNKERRIGGIKIYENPPKKGKGYNDDLQPSLFDHQQQSDEQNINTRDTKSQKKSIDTSISKYKHNQKDFEQMQMSLDFESKKKNEYTIPKSNTIKLYCSHRVGKYLSWQSNNDVDKIIEDKCREWEGLTPPSNPNLVLKHKEDAFFAIKSFFEKELYDSLDNDFMKKNLGKNKQCRNLFIPKIYQREQQFFVFPSNQFFMNIKDFYKQYDDLEIQIKPLNTKSKKRYAKKIKNEHESYELSNYTNVGEMEYWSRFFKKIESNYYSKKNFSTLECIFDRLSEIAIEKQIKPEFSHLIDFPSIVWQDRRANRRKDLKHNFYDKISNFIKQKEPIEMIKCTSGSFLANPYASKNLNEKPIYKEIKNDFWLSSEPVSELLWLAIMGIYPRYNDNNNNSIYEIFHKDTLSANLAYLMSSMDENVVWHDSNFVFFNPNVEDLNVDILLNNNKYSDFSNLNSPIRGLAPSLDNFEMMIIFCNRLSKLYGFKPYYKIKRKKHSFQFCSDPQCKTWAINVEPFTKPNFTELALELESEYRKLTPDELATKKFTIDSFDVDFYYDDIRKFHEWSQEIRKHLKLSEMNEYTFDVEIDEESNGFRLPLDIEWQYASSTHQNTCFSGFDELDKDLNPYSNTSIYQLDIGLDHIPKNHAIYSIENILFNRFSQTKSPTPNNIGIPNSWGFKNMTGNVWEICVDSELYSRGENFNTRSLVCKGGAFNSFFISKDDVIKHHLDILKAWNIIQNDPTRWPYRGIADIKKSINEPSNSNIKMLIENIDQCFEFFHYSIPCFANDVSIDHSSKFMCAITDDRVSKITPTQMNTSNYVRRGENLGIIQIPEKQKKAEDGNSKLFQNNKQYNKYKTNQWDSYTRNTSTSYLRHKHVIDSLFAAEEQNIYLRKDSIESKKTIINPKFVGFRVARNIPKK